MTFGPSFELGHTLEASLFIHFRRLEVVARHPDPANTSNACLLDESIQQRAPVSPAPICLIDPHLSQFRNAGPCVTGRDTDHLSQFIADYKAQALTIVPSCHLTVVFV